MTPATLLPLAVLGIAAAAAGWVLQDARARARTGRPVRAVLLGVPLEQPEVWALLCLLAGVFFIPLYLVARRQT
jgi:hypothetical protein